MSVYDAHCAHFLTKLVQFVLRVQYRSNCSVMRSTFDVSTSELIISQVAKIAYKQSSLHLFDWQVILIEGPTGNLLLMDKLTHKMTSGLSSVVHE